MTNEIAIVADQPFRRVAKSGKVTVRGTLGVLMSGNRAEMGTLSRIAAKNLIANNTFGPVMDEISRVFPASALLKHGVFKVGDTFATYEAATKTITHIGAPWNAASAETYCTAVLAKCAALEAADKAVKGEKLLAELFAEELVAHVKAKREAKTLELATSQS